MDWSDMMDNAQLVCAFLVAVASLSLYAFFRARKTSAIRKEVSPAGLRSCLVAAMAATVATLVWCLWYVLADVLLCSSHLLAVGFAVVSGVSKLAIIALFPFALGRLHESLYRSYRRTTLFGLLYCLLFGTVGLIYVVLVREHFAVYASDDEGRFYYMNPGPLDTYHYIGLGEWREEWKAWIPQTKEAILMALSMLAITVPGFLVRKNPLSVAISAFLFYAIVIILPPVNGLFVWDYDCFLGGVFFDVLCFELLPPLWWRVGTSTIMFFVLALMFYTLTYLFVRAAERPSVLLAEETAEERS